MESGGEKDSFKLQGENKSGEGDRGEGRNRERESRENKNGDRHQSPLFSKKAMPWGEKNGQYK